MDSGVDSASKRKRDELDRISSLPSGVTQQILSCLPIKEAVRTSVLSKNWRHRWAMIRHLVFDDRCISQKNKGYGGGAARVTEFENVVDRVLLLHCGSIDTFELSSYLAEASSLDRWFLHLLRNSNSVKEVVLKLERENYKVSSCLFLLPDLTRLELSKCSLKPPVEFRGFPRLKSLEIFKVTVAQDVLEKIISCCPLLERMTLRGFKSITRLNVDAPNLQFLEIGGGFQSFELKNTPNLVAMKVHGFRGVKAEVDFLKALLLSSPLQELEFSFGRKNKMIKLDVNWNCTSTLLRVLKFSGFCGSCIKDITFIRFLLSSSPVLERMTLQPTEDRVSWELPKVLQSFKDVKINFMDPSRRSCYLYRSAYSSESSSDEDSTYY